MFSIGNLFNKKEEKNKEKTNTFDKTRKEEAYIKSIDTELNNLTLELMQKNADMLKSIKLH